MFIIVIDEVRTNFKSERAFIVSMVQVIERIDLAEIEECQQQEES